MNNSKDIKYWYIISSNDKVLENGKMLHEQAWIYVTKKYSKQFNVITAHQYDTEENYKIALKNLGVNK